MGVDTAQFHPSVRNVNRSQDCTRSYPKILFVGRLVEQKGLKYLIQAMKEVCASFPNARLTVVGEGPEESALKKLADPLKLTLHIEFVGPITNEDLPFFTANQMSSLCLRLRASMVAQKP
jgi:glycosyltransferase involved in cell wall biosynthesis